MKRNTIRLQNSIAFLVLLFPVFLHTQTLHTIHVPVSDKKVITDFYSAAPADQVAVFDTLVSRYMYLQDSSVIDRIQEGKYFFLHRFKTCVHCPAGEKTGILLSLVKAYRITIAPDSDSVIFFATEGIRLLQHDKTLPEKKAYFHFVRSQQYLYFKSPKRTQEAMEDMLAALSLYKKAGNKRRVAQMQCDMAQILQYSDIPEEVAQAESYIRKGLAVFRQLDQADDYSITVGRLALFYMLHNDVSTNAAIRDSCISTLQSSLDWYRQKKTEPLSQTYLIMAQVYSNAKMYDKVISYIDSVRHHSRLYGLFYSGIQVNLLVANAYEKKQQYKEAEHAFAAIDTSRLNMELAEEIVGYYKLAFEMAKRKNNLPLAFRYLETYSNLSDSLSRTKLKEKANQINNSYFTIKKELQIAALERKQLTQYFLIGISVLLIMALAIVFLLAYRKKKQTLNKLLQQLDDAAKKQTARIKEATEHALRQERYQIGLDLHDELAASLAGVFQYLEAKTQTGNEEETLRYRQMLTQLSQAYDKARKKSHELTGMMQPVSEPFYEEVRSILDLAAGTPALRLTYDIEDLKMVSLLPDIQIGLIAIIRESLTNIYKHAKAKNVDVLAYQEDTFLVIAISDDGVGFTRQDKTKRKAGVGLKAMTHRIRSLGGTISIHSEPGDGTRLSIQLPCQSD